MQAVKDLAELEALYGEPSKGSLTKVQPRITSLYRQWIAGSRFAILSTVGPEGTDASPRGDVGPVVEVVDGQTLYLPDWKGNNRADSLRNIVRDGRVSLMFLVPGSNNVVRVNGTAIVTADEAAIGRFRKGNAQPRTVIVVKVGEVYFQCAKALMRSGLWQQPDVSGAVPTAGQFLKEVEQGMDAQALRCGISRVRQRQNVVAPVGVNCLG